MLHHLISDVQLLNFYYDDQGNFDDLSPVNNLSFSNLSFNLPHLSPLTRILTFGTLLPIECSFWGQLTRRCAVMVTITLSLKLSGRILFLPNPISIFGDLLMASCMRICWLRSIWVSASFKVYLFHQCTGRGDSTFIHWGGTCYSLWSYFGSIFIVSVIPN